MRTETIRQLLQNWQKPIEGGQTEGPARLGAILVLLLIAGLIIHGLPILMGSPQPAADYASLGLLGLFLPLYFIQRRGHRRLALAMTIGLLLSLAALPVFSVPGARLFTTLYYLFLVILLSGLFLPLTSYIVIGGAALVLGLMLSIPLRTWQEIPELVLGFGTLLGLVMYFRPGETTQVPGTQAQGRAAEAPSRAGGLSGRFALLAEIARQVTDSLDETEILQKTLEAVVEKFGYAEAAIFLLVGNDTLEVKALAGTEDLGIHPGYTQKVGVGIAGHVAETGETHLAPDISRDPYYVSPVPRNGSAVGIPTLDHEQVLGVLYLEDKAQDAFAPEDIQTLQAITTQVAISLQKARLYTRTRRHLRMITTLQSISDAVTSSHDLNEIFRIVLQLLQSSFGYGYVSIYVLDDDMLRLGSQAGYPEESILREVSVEKGVMGRAARTGHTQFVRDAAKDPDFLRAASDVQSEIAVPLLRDEHVLGVLNIESSVPLGAGDLDLLNTLAGPVAIAIENAHLHAELKRLAWTDALSGLSNRRAFDQMLDTEVARADRYGHALSLIIMDLDSFKEYNDRWGHLAGDERLKQLAGMLRQAVREPDITARYGGEEFAAILPDTGKDGALALAERLRACAEAQSPTPDRRRGPISGYTISVGVASYPQDAVSAHELLLAADNAELTAKRMGKNRVFSR